MKNENQNSGFRQYIAKEYKNLVLYVKKNLNERYYNVIAEDIVQDVALNLFSKLDIDSKIENIAGYVYRSIRNRIVDTHRKHKYEIKLEKFNGENDDDNDNLVAKMLSKVNNNDLEIIDSELFYKKFNEAFKLLSAKQQAIIIATEFEGQTFDEISDEWGIPIGTLLSWKHRGIKKLKENIKLDDFYTENEINNN